MTKIEVNVFGNLKQKISCHF